VRVGISALLLKRTEGERWEKEVWALSICALKEAKSSVGKEIVSGLVSLFERTFASVGSAGRGLLRSKLLDLRFSDFSGGKGDGRNVGEREFGIAESVLMGDSETGDDSFEDGGDGEDELFNSSLSGGDNGGLKGLSGCVISFSSRIGLTRPFGPAVNRELQRHSLGKSQSLEQFFPFLSDDEFLRSDRDPPELLRSEEFLRS
jgi:hypothetical protein